MPRAGGGRGKWIGVALAVALAGGGYFALERGAGRDDGEGRPAGHDAVAQARDHRGASSERDAEADSPAVRKVTLKLASDPSGARVVDDAATRCWGRRRWCCPVRRVAL